METTKFTNTDELSNNSSNSSSNSIMDSIIQYTDINELYNDNCGFGYEPMILLDDKKYNKIKYHEYTNNKFNATLFKHQEIILKAMLDLENTRKYETKWHKFPYKENNYDILSITYNTAILSEPVGSGKTIDVLALICNNKIPRVIPDILELKTPSNTISTGFVKRKFNKIIKSTLIFVGVSVVKQWDNAIKKFTNLTYFTVSGAKDLKKLFNMISNNIVDEYDIILVKNGKITVNIELPEGIKKENKNNIKQPYIYNLITNLRNYCWARVVIDDFDTIKLPTNSSTPNGLFVWYISSTNKVFERRYDNKIKYNRASDWLKYNDYTSYQIMNNRFLSYMLNVRNDPDFLESSISLPFPKYHVVLFKNPNDIYISLLNSMHNNDINQITEMINGDALKSAAEAVGIKSNTVADIFGKILGNKYKEYRFAGDLLEFIKYQRKNEPDRKSIPKGIDLDEIDEDGIKIYRYGKNDLIKFRDIEYKFPGVNKIIDDTDEEYKEIKKNNGIAIDRVKNNIKHGECSVCTIDLRDENEIIIVKCCQAVFCGNCGIKAQNILNNNLQDGRCSNCRQTLNIKDLMYIGDEIDIKDIEDENFEDEEDDEDDEKSLINNKITNDKYSTIIDIIHNRPINNSKLVDLNMPNVIKGSFTLEEAKIRKILIFANYEETLYKIVEKLEDEKIHYWRLKGGFNDIDKISKEFTNYEGTCALVINSTKHCSGLNLQTATDLIFAHVIYNKYVESQVVGRGHRLGRTSPLNIWYLMYENEYTYLKNNNDIVELN